MLEGLQAIIVLAMYLGFLFSLISVPLYFSGLHFWDLRKYLKTQRSNKRKRRRDCAPPFLFPLICSRTRAGARKCAAFFPLRPFPLSYLRFMMFRKKNFLRNFSVKTRQICGTKCGTHRIRYAKNPCISRKNI